MKRIIPSLALFFLSFAILSCGKTQPDEVDPDEIGGNQCPAAAYLTNHRVTIHSANHIPAKVAIVVDGILKYDGCLAEPTIVPPTPAVTMRALADRLEFRVVHLDAYPVLPTKMSFEVLDRKDCVAPSTTFFSATDVPLEFKTVYPHGPKCGGDIFAEVDL